MTTDQGIQPSEAAAPSGLGWGVKEVILVCIVASLFTATFWLAGFTAGGIATGIDDIVSCPNCPFAGAGLIIFAPPATVLTLIIALVVWLVLRTNNIPHRFVFPIWGLTCVLIVTVLALAGVLTLAVQDPALAYLDRHVWCLASLGLIGFLVLNVATHDGGARRAIQRLKVQLPSPWNEIPVAFGIYAMALAGSALVAYLARSYRAAQVEEVGWSETEWLVVESHPLFANSDIWWWSLLSITAAVLLVPIGAELIFRAFAFQGLVSKVRVVVAAILTATIFAIPNASLNSWLTLLLFIPEPTESLGILPVAFIMSFAFAIIYYRTKSLIFVVVMHSLHNALGITLELQGIRDLVFPVI